MSITGNLLFEKPHHSPRPSEAARLLQNHEVSAPIALDQIDRRAHPRDTGTNNDYRGVGLVLVSNGRFGPWLLARHRGLWVLRTHGRLLRLQK